MKNTNYNGWTNYATWRVNLEIFDDIDTDHWAEDIEELSEKKWDFDRLPMSYDFGQYLKDYVEQILETENELAESYAYAFINEVNWSEIAEHIIDTYRENYCCDNCNERLDERFTARYCSFKCQKEDELLATHPKG